ncbi:MAG: tyrosine-type recombinase/integrase [Bacillota bacterium]
MATIVKRENNNSIVYKFQVKYKDKGSGKVVVKSTTWTPPPKMTAKQAEREAVIEAMKYENKIKEMANACGDSVADEKLTFAEFSKIWLAKCESENSVSYYMNSRSTVEGINKYIGGYKLNELTPRIIQSYFNKLDKLEKVTYKVYPKAEEIRKMMEGNPITFTELSAKVGQAAVVSSLKGRTLSKGKADKIAKILGVKTERLYDIEKTTTPYAHETIHKIKRTMRAIMSLAKKQRLVTDNFASAEYIDSPRRQKKEVDYLSDEEVGKLYAVLDSWQTIQQKTAVMTVLMTGIRRGELCGLDWEDLDLEDGILQIKRSVSVVIGVGKVEKQPKTNSSFRSISIGEKLTKQLAEYKKWQEEKRASLGDAWKGTTRVFTGEFGDKIGPNITLKWFQSMCETAGLRKVTLHSLRHTNITMQITAGVPISIVSARAGHAKTSTTTDIYTHFLKSGDRDAAKKIDAMFG